MDIRPLFFGGALTALNKSDGGIRPIAVGSTLRQLVCKLVNKAVRDDLGDLFRPTQLGFGTCHGSEAAVHAARHSLNNMSSSDVFVKLDIRNAFNTIRRDRILQEVKEKLPHLFPLVYCSYSTTSHLFFGSESILSSEGIQQGDPLGPLLFCLAIDPILKELQSPFKVFYIDDGSICGDAKLVAQDVALFESKAPTLGLTLNHSKSEFICVENQEIQSHFPDFKWIQPKDAFLLGSPIGDEKSVDLALSEKLGFLQTMGNRLAHLPR